MNRSNGIAASSIEGFVGVLTTRSFSVVFTASTSGPNVDEFLVATWAYTAP